MHHPGCPTCNSDFIAKMDKGPQFSEEKVTQTMQQSSARISMI